MHVNVPGMLQIEMSEKPITANCVCQIQNDSKVVPGGQITQLMLKLQRM